MRVRGIIILVTCQGNSPRCLQWRSWSNFQDLFPDFSSSLEAESATSSSVIQSGKKQIRINNLWIQYRWVVWIIKHRSDLFHILLCWSHLLGGRASGIPASLLHLLNTGTDLPLQLPGWSGGRHRSKVKISYTKTEYLDAYVWPVES